MKFICSKQSIMDAINTVNKAVLSKASLQILEGIYIEASDRLKLMGNNYDLGIEYFLDADIIDKGSIVINAKILSDIIRSLPDTEVLIENDDNYKVKIECNNSHFEISGISSDGYHVIPEIEKNDFISIK